MRLQTGMSFHACLNIPMLEFCPSRAALTAPTTNIVYNVFIRNQVSFRGSILSSLSKDQLSRQLCLPRSTSLSLVKKPPLSFPFQPYAFLPPFSKPPSVGPNHRHRFLSFPFLSFPFLSFPFLSFSTLSRFYETAL